MPAKPIGLRFDEDMLAEIDSVRGMVPRAVWIHDACRLKLDGGLTSSVRLPSAKPDAGSSLPGRYAPKPFVAPRPKRGAKS